MSQEKEQMVIVDRGEAGKVDIDLGEYTIATSVGIIIAKRIVACVNACAGISTERLEKFLGATANKSVITLTTDNIDLKKQRDDLAADIATLDQEARQVRARLSRVEGERDGLLEALTLICPDLNFTGWENGDGEDIGTAINAAIAAAKGGAA